MSMDDLALRRYAVWCPKLGQGEDGALELNAAGPFSAAELWASSHDEAHKFVRIADRAPMIVMVRCTEPGVEFFITEMIVRGETRINYSAQRYFRSEEGAQ